MKRDIEFATTDEKNNIFQFHVKFVSIGAANQAIRSVKDCFLYGGDNAGQVSALNNQYGFHIDNSALDLRYRYSYILGLSTSKSGATQHDSRVINNTASLEIEKQGLRAAL